MQHTPRAEVKKDPTRIHLVAWEPSLGKRGVATVKDPKFFLFDKDFWRLFFKFYEEMD